MFAMMRNAYGLSGGGGGVVAASAPVRNGKRPRIGLALGSGVARGWCHIGILRAFSEAGLKPDVIAGTSIGAVVGGCYAAGKLDDLEEFARGLTKRRLLSMLDLTFSGGILGGARLREKLEATLGGHTVESLPIAFAAVATELSSGHEIWLRRGSLSHAVIASYAMPGLFEPARVDGRILVDGALVNPIPVSVCRALGADIVIAIGLVSDSMFRGTVMADRRVEEDAVATLAEEAEAQPASWAPGGLSPRAFLSRYMRRGRGDAPGIASVMVDSFAIIHDRIARSRLAGDPPDILINARLDQFGLFEFHRAAELIAIGSDTAKRWLPEINDLVGAAEPAPVA